MIQYSVSIPASNVSVERIFSVMSNLSIDEHNRLKVGKVTSELDRQNLEDSGTTVGELLEF